MNCCIFQSIDYLFLLKEISMFDEKDYNKDINRCIRSQRLLDQTCQQQKQCSFSSFTLLSFARGSMFRGIFYFPCMILHDIMTWHVTSDEHAAARTQQVCET